MRLYIQEHQTESIPAGLNLAIMTVVVQAPGVPTILPVGGFPVAQAQSQEEQEEQEQEWNVNVEPALATMACLWAYDTFEGALAAGWQSTAGAIELIRDAWDQLSTPTILYFVIALLVLGQVKSYSVVSIKCNI